MKSVRIFSQILFWLTRIFFLGYFLSFTLAFVAFVTGWSLRLEENGTRFIVLYPFTEKRYLLGENHFGYILTMLLILGLYALFFWLLSNVFRVFTKDKLFTEQTIAQLKWFYTSNFILPLAATVFLSFFMEIESPTAEGLIALHALLGVFTYFIAAICRQGVHLQNEQDLFI